MFLSPDQEHLYSRSFAAKPKLLELDIGAHGMSTYKVGDNRDAEASTDH